ncbi:MAG: pentapeptide repeat-containing protein [Candidatus Sericytochromatia bacterium]
MVWIVVIGIGALMAWAFWHERQLKQQDQQGERQKVQFKEEREQLEVQARNQRQQERASEIHVAVAQLNDPALTQRLHALQSLQRVFYQAPDWEQWNLLTLLCTHVQERFGGQTLQSPLPEDFLAILRFFSGRPEGYKRHESGLKDCLRLRDLHLQGLAFHALNLKGAEVSHCVWEQAQLRQLNGFAAQFKDCRFARMDLRQANFTGALLEQVDLRGSALEGSEWISAELQGCDLREAQLAKSSWRGARLRDCDLRGADLRGAEGLVFEQLLSCKLDAQTRLPERLQARHQELLSRQI